MKNQFFYREFYKRNLPHFQPANGTFFITICLAKALTGKKIEDLRQKKADFERMFKNVDPSKRLLILKEFHRSYFKDFDSFINSQSKKDWLSQPTIEEKIKENLFHWNSIRYSLVAFCIMPNHIHILLKPIRESLNIYESLSQIMFSMKSYTANECNKILDRTGQFWLHESYDHYIRDSEDYEFHVNYILQNPVKANLVNCWQDWHGTWLSEHWQNVEI
ncbi:MAG TPA: transposase [Candidatus Cloacimonadota bacterium]|nr:transposase [Candidatus Cloacimonadota bacterium]